MKTEYESIDMADVAISDVPRREDPEAQKILGVEVSNAVRDVEERVKAGETDAQFILELAENMGVEWVHRAVNQRFYKFPEGIEVRTDGEYITIDAKKLRP